MWVPTHYAVLIIAILLLESAALFAYTLIGLLKSNPLPWMLPPPTPEYPLCRYAYQDGQQATLRGGPAVNIQPQEPADSGFVVVTSTSVLYQTRPAPTNTPNRNIALDLAQNIQAAASVGLLTTLTTTDNNGHTTIITSHAPAPTSSGSDESSAATSESDDDNETSVVDIPDKAQVSTVMLNGTPTTISQAARTDVHDTTRTASVRLSTRVTFLTSTLPPHKPDQPQSTSTTVVVVQPSKAPDVR